MTFREFLLKQNFLSLALAVVIGGAVGKVITALVADWIMPVVGAVTPTGDWQSWTWQVGSIKFGVGDFLGAVLDFLIIAWVTYRIALALLKPEPAAPTKECGECREIIPAAAKKCKFCTSPV